MKAGADGCGWLRADFIARILVDWKLSSEVDRHRGRVLVYSRDAITFGRIDVSACQGFERALEALICYRAESLPACLSRPRA